MLVLFVLALLVLLGFAALGIDVGYLYSVKTELQRSADAGALGGAYVFNDGDWSSGPAPPGAMRTKAVARAQEAAMSDPVGATPLSAGEVDPPTFPSVNHIRVTVHRSVKLFFAGMIGVPSVTVSATATAEAVRVDQNVQCLKPLAVPLPYFDADHNGVWNSGDGDPTAPTQGTFVNGLRVVDSSIGSYHDVRDNSGRLFALDMCGTGGVGSTSYQSWIEASCTQTCSGGAPFVASLGDRIWVKRSPSPSTTIIGLNHLINPGDPLATFNYDAVDYPNLPGSGNYHGPNWINSPRVMRVVLYNPKVVAGASQNDLKIPVWGFAGFWIGRAWSENCNCRWVWDWRHTYRRRVCDTCSYVDGYFIPDSAVGTASGAAPSIQPSVKMTRLVQ